MFRSAVVVFIMALLLLCTDNVLRKNKKLNSGGKPQTTVKRMTPPVHWLDSLARQHGLAHLVDLQRQQKHLDARAAEDAVPDQSRVARCIAIAKVESGRESRGILTPWTEEERYLGRFFDDHSDAGQSISTMDSFCSVRVVKFLPLDPVLEVDCPFRFRFNFWSPQFPLTWDEVEQSCGMSRVQFERRLSCGPEEVAEFLQAPCGLRMPPLPLQLILRRVWTHCLLEDKMFLAQKFQFSSAVDAFQKKSIFPASSGLRRAKRNCKTLPKQRRQRRHPPYQVKLKMQVWLCLRQQGSSISLRNTRVL